MTESLQAFLRGLMFSSVDNKSLKIGVARSNELTDWSAELGERRTFDWRAQFTFVDFDVIGCFLATWRMILKWNVYRCRPGFNVC